ncbi:MAG: MBL fold metallo-hydrolase [Acidimicrobiia bacterium]|nr:MBL fold metallo-hydrolase [Acidimicrobiia bacterium]
MSTNQLPAADTTIPIEAPTACAPYAVGDGITVLPNYLPVPGMGVLPAHAFVLDGPEPMLVDTGPGGAEAGFQEALASVVDPAELSWLWLTHTDPDHIGSLRWLIDAAPQMRVVTTYLAVGKLGMQLQVPLDRLLWVNPGTTVELNGRALHALRPPSFDAPETTAFFDATSGTLFSADTFGALLQQPTADAADIAAADLADGMVLWSTIDSPWVTYTDRAHFGRALDQVRALGARRVLSSHLPPAAAMAASLVENLARVPGCQPWTGPDQAALDQLLASVGG